MQNQYPASFNLYKEINKLTPLYITKTLKRYNQNIGEELKKYKRVFFVGLGSSEPAAKFASYYLHINSNLNANFVSPSLILDNNLLSKKDAIFLISFGMDRAESILISKKITCSDAAFFVCTAHPERVPSEKKTHIQQIFPKKEKLFCRPASPLTSYAAMAKIAFSITNRVLDEKKLITAWREGYSAKLPLIVPGKKYIILSTSLGMASAVHLTLALREGSGIDAEVYDIESYGHGWYVTHQLQRLRDHESLKYIFISHQKDSYIENATKRILPLIEKTNSLYAILRTKYDAVYGNCYVMGWTSRTIENLNEETHFDMNNPPGKEENRAFHEV